LATVILGSEGLAFSVAHQLTGPTMESEAMQVAELAVFLQGMPADARVDTMINGYPNSAYPVVGIELLVLHKGEKIVVLNCVDYDPAIAAA